MFTFHTATLDDAEQIADIIIATSEGIVEHLLEDLIPGLSAKMILSAAFIQREGPYNTDNVIRCMHGNAIVGLLFSYPSSEHAVPLLMESMLPAKRLAAARPVLERCAPDSLYINSIWIAESYRGQKYGSALMLEAFSRCKSLGLQRVSLFCWNDNERAMRFYAKKGFALYEHLPPDLIPVKGHALGGSILSCPLQGG
jgi:Acetyltransferases